MPGTSEAPSPTPSSPAWRGGLAGLTLVLLACAPALPRVDIPAERHSVDPRWVLGTFEDDYGERYDITKRYWAQLPHGKLLIERLDLEHGFLIAQNDSANAYDPGKWSRIDWVKLEGMAPWEWAFCLSAYDAPTADSALATRIAERDRPRTGCNGHPFTRLKRYHPPTPSMVERCHEAYLTAGSDGPRLLAVDSLVVDDRNSPPTRCGQLRSAHPAIKSSE